MSYHVNKKILAIRTVGNVLILIAAVSLLYTFWPLISVSSRHFVEKVQGKKYQAAQSGQTFGGLLGNNDQNIKVLVPKDPNFSIIVEKIGADAPVIPNVDPASKDVYQAALKRGVAHALGTSFPGQPGISYLFAHSTDTIFNVPRYNAIFYLLGDMKAGDKIVVFFAGKRYDYVVTETKITDPEDVSYLTLKTPEQILVLQTCYPPGTLWKRLLVIAKPASDAI
ncbi:sortase [Candidatus Curtissbacteria bacterium]|nr:sortase [Candidatus Curtissbacteria bacterium]